MAPDPSGKSIRGGKAAFIQRGQDEAIAGARAADTNRCGRIFARGA